VAASALGYAGGHLVVSTDLGKISSCKTDLTQGVCQYRTDCSFVVTMMSFSRWRRYQVLVDIPSLSLPVPYRDDHKY
jgi:hypothetical protein